MAKFDRFKAAVNQALTELQKPANMKKFGQDAAEMIRLRTRLGSGVAKHGAPKTKLKPLSDSYKAQRQGKIAFFTKGKGSNRIVVPYTPESKPKLHGETSAGKSNLTFTGKMLDSVDVTSVRSGEVIVGPSGNRGDGKTNEQVAEYVTEAGRPFNHLSNVEVKRIKDSISDTLNKLITKILTK